MALDQQQDPPVAVWVHWKPIAEGGKKTLPLGGLYYVVTEALPSSATEAPCSWSLVLHINQNDSNEDGVRLGLGEAHFLMDHAPSELLTSGFTVAIYEGPTCVGQVSVL